MLTKGTANQCINLVKAMTKRYIFFITSDLRYKKSGEPKMAASAHKPRPAHVPEENVYEKTHWLLIVTYLVASLSVYLLISNAG